MSHKAEKKEKLSWSLLPLSAVGEILRVLQWANTKKDPPYDPNSWQDVPNARQEYYDAAMRHLTDYWERHERGLKMPDDESGLHVLAHAACCILFLLWFELLGIEDPPKKKD